MPPPRPAEIDSIRQTQMLKLVTHSFCRELGRYGVDRGDIVTVSSLVLDYLVSDKAPTQTVLRAPDVDVAIVRRHWREHGTLTHADLSLRPLTVEMVPRVAGWLADPGIQAAFAVPFPIGEPALRPHLIENPDRSYFGLFINDRIIGAIGADAIDSGSRKLEMKKFIGEPAYRGKGLGKLATFMWLCYVFDVVQFNKVYIHTLDTNIRNINLNAQLGFELEGILFQDIYVDGVPRDVLRMSLLRDRWTGLFGSANVSGSVKDETNVSPCLPSHSVEDSYVPTSVAGTAHR